MHRKNKFLYSILALLFIIINCTPVFAKTIEPYNSKVILNEYPEILDDEQLLSRAKNGINESNNTITAKLKYSDNIFKTETIDETYELNSTTQLLSTYLQNGKIVKSYAITVFADLSKNSIDPQNLMKLTLYYTDTGFLTFRYSSVSLLTTASFPSLVITNTVYEGLETGISHSNSNVYPNPGGINTLSAPTSLPVGGGLASLTAEARLNLYNGTNTYCLVSVI